MITDPATGEDVAEDAAAAPWEIQRNDDHCDGPRGDDHTPPSSSSVRAARQRKRLQSGAPIGITPLAAELNVLLARVRRHGTVALTDAPAWRRGPAVPGLEPVRTRT